MDKHTLQVIELSDCTYQFDVQENASGKRYVVIKQSGSSGENEVLRFLEQDVGDLIRALRQIKKHLAAENPQLHSSYARVKREYPRAWSRWTAEDEAILRRCHHAGDTLEAMAGRLQRHPKSIHRRLKKLELVPADQNYQDYDQGTIICSQTDWTVKLDNDLIDAYSEGVPLEELAARFGLETQAVRARLKILAVW